MSVGRGNKVCNCRFLRKARGVCDIKWFLTKHFHIAGAFSSYQHSTKVDHENYNKYSHFDGTPMRMFGDPGADSTGNKAKVEMGRNKIPPYFSTSNVFPPVSTFFAFPLSSCWVSEDGTRVKTQTFISAVCIFVQQNSDLNQYCAWRK